MTEQDAILQAIKSLEAMVLHQHSHFNERFDAQDRALTRHMEEEEGMIKRFMSGFPGEDPRTHCLAHEEWIAEVKQRKEFYAKLRFELARWGLIGLIGWLLVQVWTGILKGPHS